MNEKINDIRILYEFYRETTYIEIYQKNSDEKYEFISAFKKMGVGLLSNLEKKFYYDIYLMSKNNAPNENFEFLNKRKFVLGRFAKN